MRKRPHVGLWTGISIPPIQTADFEGRQRGDLLGGWSSADIRGELTVAAPPFTATRQGETSDSRYGIGDLAPFAAPLFQRSGVTYNLWNPSTDYRNGWDWHLDWGASQFLSKTVQVGVVGYVYAQFPADQGAAKFLGANLSRVAAVGPQLGFILPSKTVQTFLSFKAFREFAADNRASGWNAWVILSFSPAPPETSPAKEAR
jgi:Putative MetA-pathway of phenol degradation